MHQLSTLSGAILDPMLRTDPVGPRITYYDDATGERIELSGVTLANWAAKTGNLLRDELGAGPASRVAILLPAHWQTAAVLFGVWWIGAEALLDAAAAAGPPIDLALCTAERLDEADSTSAAARQLTSSDRVLSTASWTRPDDLVDGLLSILAVGASLVQVANPDPSALERRIATEKVTRVL